MTEEEKTVGGKTLVEYDVRVAEGILWWANYVAERNHYWRNKNEVAIGCALDPKNPLTSERRYV